VAHLLHIDSSPLATGSTSKALGQIFRRVWAEEQPQDTVAYRDLGLNPVPYLEEAGIHSQFIPEHARTPEQSAARALRDELAAELVAADTVLLGAPIYNWTVPAQLKTWIDQVTVAGSVLAFGGAPKPLGDRPVTILLAYGGDFRPGSEDEKYDYLAPYLRTLFEHTLGMKATIISAHLTIAGKAPGLDHLVDVAAESLKQAEQDVEEQARKLASQF
jgi:FMN-dependent NADH-azoreductase